MIGDTRRTVVTVAIAVVVAALLLGGGYGTWYLFLRPAGPAAVGETAVPLPSTVGTAQPLTGGIDGAWKVDSSIGSFSDFSSSWVGYRVQEQLASIGGNIAVGRTPDVSGTMTIAGTMVTAASFEADLTTLASDDPRRDGRLRDQGIETGQFPKAQFKLTSPIDLGSVPANGTEISLTASGQLTLHGQTKDVQIPLKATLSGSTITVTGSLTIVWTDYGITKPSSFAVVSVADQGTLEFQLRFTRG